MLTLSPPTRPALVSFWIASCTSAGVVLVLALWVLEIVNPVVWGFLAVTTSCLPGCLRPGLVRRPYDAWNRLSHVVRRSARVWLTGVAFLIVAVVGRSGARLAWNAPDGDATGWTRKRPASSGSHRTTSDVADVPGGKVGWIRALASWAVRSGNAWVWSLIPALALLKVVEDRPGRSLGGNVYTLY